MPDELADFLKKKPRKNALSQAEMENVLRQAGWPEQEIPKMSAIGMGESSGRVDAFNPGVGHGGKPTKEKSHGLWQINTLAHPQYDPAKLKSDPIYNAKAALDIYKKQGLKAWGAYTDGRYKKHFKGTLLPSDGSSIAPQEPADELMTFLSQGKPSPEQDAPFGTPEEVQAWNTRFPEAAVKPRLGQMAQQAAGELIGMGDIGMPISGTATPAEPAPNEADFQEWRAFKKVEDTPESRLQFEVDLKANASFGSDAGATQTEISQPQGGTVKDTVSQGIQRDALPERAPTQFKASDKPLNDDELLKTNVTYPVDLTNVRGNKTEYAVEQVRQALMRDFGMTPEQSRVAVGGLQGDLPEDYNGIADLHIPRSHLATAIGVEKVKVDYDKERADPTLAMYEQARGTQSDAGLQPVPDIDQATANVMASPFGGSTEADIQNERARLQRESLTPEEQAEAVDVGQNISDDTLATLESGLIGAGGRTLSALAGVIRASDGIGVIPESWRVALSKEGQKYQLASETESKKNTGIVNSALRIATGLAGDLPRFLLLSKLPGGMTVVFGADAGLQSVGRGETAEQVVTETSKGAAIGAIFSGASKLSQAIENGTLKAAALTGEKATPKQRLAAKVFGESTRIGTIIAGTSTVERFSGATPAESLEHGIVMALTDIAMRGGTSVKASDIKSLAGKIFRARKGDEVVDVTVEPQGTVKLLKGEVPEEVVDVEMVFDPVDQVYKAASEKATETAAPKRIGEAEISDTALTKYEPKTPETPVSESPAPIQPNEVLLPAKAPVAEVSKESQIIDTKQADVDSVDELSQFLTQESQPIQESPSVGEGEPALTPSTTSEARRAMAEGVAPEEVALRYDLKPEQVAQLAPLGEIGQFGQTSHVLRVGLLDPKNTPLFNELSRIFTQGDTSIADRFTEDRKGAADALLDSIAQSVGKPRSSQMNPNDWTQVLLQKAQDMPVEGIMLIDKAISKQGEWHKNLLDFVNDSDLKQTIDNALVTFGVTEYDDLEKKGEGLKLRKDILRIGRKYASREGIAGLSDAAIKEAYNRTVLARLPDKSGGRDVRAESEGMAGEVPQAQQPEAEVSPKKEAVPESETTEKTRQEVSNGTYTGHIVNLGTMKRVNYRNEAGKLVSKPLTDEWKPVKETSDDISFEDIESTLLSPKEESAKEIKRYVGLPLTTLARTAKFSVADDGMILADNPQAAAFAHGVVQLASGRDTKVFGGFHGQGKTASGMPAIAKRYGVDFALDSQHGDITLAINFGEAAKFTQQEERSHRADFRSRDFKNLPIEPYKEVDAYNKAAEGLRERYGDDERTIHNEIVGKLTRDDAAQELGITEAELAELRDFHGEQLLKNGVTAETIATNYAGVSKAAEEFINEQRTRDAGRVDAGRESAGEAEIPAQVSRTPEVRTGRDSDSRPFAERDAAGSAGKDRATELFEPGRTGDERLATRDPQTPEFKKWFGDSKVVDENGKPLVVYKGMYPYDYNQTPEPELTTIDRQTPFPPFDDGGVKVKVAGFFGDIDTANRFAGLYEGNAVFPVYLSIQKPFIIDGTGKMAGDLQFGRGGEPFKQAMQSDEYDGVIFENTKDEGTIYVTKQADQAKSAIGNRGTFDPDDDDIVFSIPKDAEFETLEKDVETNLEKITSYIYDGKRDVSLPEATVNLIRTGYLAGLSVLKTNLQSNTLNVIVEQIAKPWMASVDILNTKFNPKAKGMRTVPGLSLFDVTDGLFGKTGTIRAGTVVGKDSLLRAITHGVPPKEAAKFDLENTESDMESDTPQPMQRNFGVPALDKLMEGVKRLSIGIDRPYKAYARTAEMRGLSRIAAKNMVAMNLETDWRAAMKTIQKDPGAMMFDLAEHYAETLTFQNPNPITHVLDKFKAILLNEEMIAKLIPNAAHHRMAKYLGGTIYLSIGAAVPFMRTPVNVGIRSLEYTPLGAVAAAWKFHRIGDGYERKHWAADAENARKQFLAKQKKDRLEDDRAFKKETRARMDKYRIQKQTKLEEVHQAAEKIEAEAISKSAKTRKFERLREQKNDWLTKWQNAKEGYEAKRTKEFEAVENRRKAADMERVQDLAAEDVVADIKFTAMENKMFAEAAGRAGFGMTVGSLVLLGVMQGLIEAVGTTDYDDEKEKYFAKRAAGIPDNSIKIGNRRYPFDRFPAGNALAMGINLLEQYERPGSPSGRAFAMTDRLRKDLQRSNPITTDDFTRDDFWSWFGAQVAATTPIVNMKILQEVADVTDPKARKYFNEGFIPQFQSRIPGLRQGLKPSTSALGERGDFPSRLGRLFDPMRSIHEIQPQSTLKPAPIKGETSATPKRRRRTR